MKATEKAKNKVQTKVKNYKQDLTIKKSIYLSGWILLLTGSLFVGSYFYITYKSIIDSFAYDVYWVLEGVYSLYILLLTGDNLSRGIALIMTGLIILHTWNKSRSWRS
jgi:hypothetical protein